MASKRSFTGMIRNMVLPRANSGPRFGEAEADAGGTRSRLGKKRVQGLQRTNGKQLPAATQQRQTTPRQQQPQNVAPTVPEAPPPPAATTPERKPYQAAADDPRLTGAQVTRKPLSTDQRAELQKIMDSGDLSQLQNNPELMQQALLNNPALLHTPAFRAELAKQEAGSPIAQMLRNADEGKPLIPARHGEREIRVPPEQRAEVPVEATPPIAAPEPAQRHSAHGGRHAPSVTAHGQQVAMRPPAPSPHG